MRAGLIAVGLLAAFAQSASAQQTFTRAEVAKLSPQELATRVLGGVAQAGKAKELKFYVSPVAPTPPWLEQVEIDMPAVYLDVYSLCQSNRLIVNFAPLDPQAKDHMFDAAYDPPTRITTVDAIHRYAQSASPGCSTLPEAAYFDAASEGDAVQAMDAFMLFRAEAEKSNSAALSCADFVDMGFCKPGTVQAIRSFAAVISIQEERRKDASIARTVVLAIPQTDARAQTELWLTVEFKGGMKLAKGALRNVWGPPIP
jgi:hypothetical protein